MKSNNTTLPEQVHNEKQNYTTLPEKVQNEKQTILHCWNRYTMKNKQYYTAEQVQNEKQTILYYTAGTVIK
jgi:hypothetical protein